MSRGINKVILIGNLGQQPNLKNFNSGASVCNVTLATSNKWRDKGSGETKEATEWHRLTFLGGSAEILVRYCKKGSKLFIEGRLQTRKWLNKLGHEQYTTEIIVSDFQMLSSKQNIDESSHTISEPEPSSLKEKNNSFTQTEQNQYTKEEIDWDKEIPW